MTQMRTAGQSAEYAHARETISAWSQFWVQGLDMSLYDVLAIDQSKLKLLKGS